MWEDWQGSGWWFAVERGVQVQNFEEYTFRAPRPGFFAGDSPESPLPSPLLHLRQQEQRYRQNLPSGVPSSVSQNSFAAIRSRLCTLPTELLWAIFYHLDIPSLLALAHPHTPKLTHTITTWAPFIKISSFPKLLPVASALRCRGWTITAILHAIDDERCVECGQFGDLFDLMVPERRCYVCFLKDRTPRLMSLEKYLSTSTDQDDLAVFGGIADEDAIEETLRQCGIRSVVPIPGYYGPKANGKVNTPVIRFETAALKRLYPLYSAADSSTSNSLSSGHSLHYTTTIRAPYYDTLNSSFNEGYLCRACASQGWLFREGYHEVYTRFYKEYPIWGLPHRRYTKEGMMQHVQQYGGVHKLQYGNYYPEMRYVHGSEFEKKVWNEPEELQSIRPLLRSLREKELTVPGGLVYVNMWLRVRSDVEAVRVLEDDGGF